MVESKKDGHTPMSGADWADPALRLRTIKLEEALRWALEWIDAVPSDTVLPTMPGFDRDYVDGLLQQGAITATPVTVALVASLREKTNFSMMGCKKALIASGGDIDMAEELLRTRWREFF